MPDVLITGTDTGVGKTYCAAQLAAELLQRGLKVGVYKPVESGLAEASSSDAFILKTAAQLAAPMDKVCPQRFAAPLAPPLAAALEQRQVDEQLMIAGYTWWQGRCDWLIVEGAGGSLSPISHRWTVLDLAMHLGLPVVVVAANRLGMINHTLLTLEALRSRRLDCVGVLINSLPTSSPGLDSSEPDPSRSSNRQLLEQFAPTLPITESVGELAEQLVRASVSVADR